MDFIYRKVVNGREVLFPELRILIEERIPNHQQIVLKTMRSFGLDNWQVIFTPTKPKGGTLLTSLKKIILSSNASKETMMETLYHEIFHAKLPCVSEDEIEEMGVTFAKLLQEVSHD